MGWSVEFSDESLGDLDAAVAFIAVDNAERAESFGFELVAVTDILETHPSAGRRVPEIADDTVRELLHRPYRVIYQVNEVQTSVEILRYWHAARGKPEL